MCYSGFGILGCGSFGNPYYGCYPMPYYSPMRGCGYPYYGCWGRTGMGAFMGAYTGARIGSSLVNIVSLFFRK